MPQAYLNGRTLDAPRGRVLGGSSSVNAMAYVRGHPEDYERWVCIMTSRIVPHTYFKADLYGLFEIATLLNPYLYGLSKFQHAPKSISLWLFEVNWAQTSVE